MAVQTRGDGSIAVSAQGTAAMMALRRYIDTPLAARVTGATPWRSNVLVKKRQLEMNVESTLQGIAIDLPAPFGKNATDNWSLRVDRGAGADSELLRRLTGLRIPPRGDAIAVSLGTSATSAAGAAATRASAVLVRRFDGKSLVADRAVVALNADAGVPDRAGVAVTGSLPYLDADRWQALLDEPARPAAAGTGTAGSATTPTTTQSTNPVAPVLPAGFNLSGINVRLGMLDVAGKRFNDVVTRMSASTPAGGVAQWSGSVTTRELSGDVTWRPEGRGRVHARLKQLTIPEDRPPAPGVRTDLAARELPGLDIVADEFVMRERRFGKLELQAANEGRDWRIEKLALTSPDGTFVADGTWQSWAARPSITMNVKLNVADAGKYLDRMGFPKTMQGGSAKLEGRIGWAGSPQSIDYATLSGGNLSLSAEKGQFLKADPGVAKLLGVLSLQSLITLDLRDMFREGFSYDNISATANVAKGLLRPRERLPHEGRGGAGDHERHGGSGARDAEPAHAHRAFAGRRRFHHRHPGAGQSGAGPDHHRAAAVAEGSAGPDLRAGVQRYRWLERSEGGTHQGGCAGRGRQAVDARSRSTLSSSIAEPIMEVSNEH